MNDILHILIRVSTSTQKEEGTSLKTQKEIGIELSKKLNMNYQIHNEGSTSSSKDTLDNRPVMLNLLRLIDEGKVKNLYVWNTDRLSRNQITWYTIRQKMIKNGVVLYTSNGIHDTQDFMENMILGILSEVSQYDNKIRTERSRLGKIEKVKLNYWRGGDCPFGYKLQRENHGNRLVENPDESKWVQFIYTEYSNGTSLKDIKSILEKNGIKTRRKNLYWSMGSLQVIIKNEIYLGYDKYVDKKTNLIIKNTIPQLISNKLWEDVQERKKIKLLRKGQINRTKNFYLFRDYMICTCGTPIGGRIHKQKKFKHYYCPLSERKFSKSNKIGLECSMIRCLNIPTTDKFLWETIVNVLTNTTELKEWIETKTLVGKGLKSNEIGEVIKLKEEQIRELNRIKGDLEKGLVKVETDNILNNYPSTEIYTSLKKNLIKKYNKTKSDIEDVKNSLLQLNNDESWYKWLDTFSKQIKDNHHISDTLKKELLKVMLDKILVEYDHNEKVHILNINFKIPVLVQREHSDITNDRVSLKPCKSAKKSINQIKPFRDYSTVTDFARLRGWSTLRPRITAT